MGLTWEEFFQPSKAAKSVRPYSLIAATAKGDEASAMWSVLYLAAGTGATFGAWTADTWFGYQMAMRFHPATAGIALVLYSPDMAFAIGEELEEQSPGSGAHMTNAMHYSSGGLMMGGDMPSIPYDSRNRSRQGMPDLSWSSIKSTFGL